MEDIYVHRFTINIPRVPRRLHVIGTPGGMTFDWFRTRVHRGVRPETWYSTHPSYRLRLGLEGPSTKELNLQLEGDFERAHTEEVR